MTTVGRQNEWGFASKASRKGEDAWGTARGEDAACYGVFDGHGGAALAKAASEEMPRHFAQLGAEAATERLVDAFYDYDYSLGQRFPSEGSTATCLVVSKTGGAATLLVAWVGDSRWVEIDMTSSELAFESPPHNVSNARELHRIERQSRGEGGDPVLDRAMAYEQRIAESDALRTGYTRLPSTVTRRRIGKREGPMVVQSWWTLAEEDDARRGASTSVTRSLGDWDSSRKLVPHPDVERRELEPGAWRRYVLASDGLWDVVRVDRVAKLIAHLSGPQAAADALLVAARKRYGGDFRDDATVLVIDVNLKDEDDSELDSSRRRRGAFPISLFRKRKEFPLRPPPSARAERSLSSPASARRLLPVGGSSADTAATASPPKTHPAALAQATHCLDDTTTYSKRRAHTSLVQRALGRTAFRFGLPRVNGGENHPAHHTAQGP
ncbi:hypothetical protein CTAYLR_001425 [Chrysophaeum taylorii]|uniref:PPM-type phosphatase domain-containing protein n=1 Tax=Chrysophaeum taylorii TaxID=2483200 RepID=A0AAD7UAK6_9STRA|nr:hypothetical protein CTAYLR_001425 [Chrysophaeum taylorii]